MPGSNGSPFTPLSVGVSDSGDFSSWLGRPVQIQEETYIMVQAGVAIASGSQGKQLNTTISSGIASWSVQLNTGEIYSVCGAIPSTLTTAIASGAYFLALRDSNSHTLALIGSTSGTFVGEALTPSTGAALINVFTSTTLSALTGVASTSSGLGALFYALRHSPGVPLQAFTGTAISITGGCSTYHAPFRGAN